MKWQREKQQKVVLQYITSHRTFIKHLNRTVTVDKQRMLSYGKLQHEDAIGAN